VGIYTVSTLYGILFFFFFFFFYYYLHARACVPLVLLLVVYSCVLYILRGGQTVLQSRLVCQSNALNSILKEILIFFISFSSRVYLRCNVVVVFNLFLRAFYRAKRTQNKKGVIFFSNNKWRHSTIFYFSRGRGGFDVFIGRRYHW